jgi:hypothetical protein
MIMTKRQAEGKQRPGNIADGGPKLDQFSQGHIGRMLKAMYDEVAREPVPDRFRELLKQLEAKEPQSR